MVKYDANKDALRQVRFDVADSWTDRGRSRDDKHLHITINHSQGIRGLFSPRQIEQILQLTQKIAA